MHKKLPGISRIVRSSDRFCCRCTVRHLALLVGGVKCALTLEAILFHIVTGIFSSSSEDSQRFVDAPLSTVL